MSKSVTRCGNGVVTLNQSKLITRMERFGIPTYTGNSVKDASEYITKWRPDYINELLYRDDVAEYLQQLSLDNDGHEQF